MTQADRSISPAEVRTLEAEIIRLNKVVQALMDRAEATAGAQLSGAARPSDYDLFQTTLMLQRQVQLKTEQVEATLQDNEATSSDLQSSAAREMHELRRTAALQIQLLELVVRQKEVGELIERVSALLSVPIVLFDSRGQALDCSANAVSSPELPRRLWTAYAALQGAPDPRGVPGGGGERFHYRDIVVLGRVERVLAAAVSAQRPAQFADASLTFLQQLVTLDVLHHRDELTKRERVRQRLLREVLAGEGMADDVQARLAEHGFGPDVVWRVAVVEPLRWTRPGAGGVGAHVRARLSQELLRATETAFEQRRVPYLSVLREERVVILSSFADARPITAHALLDDLRAEVDGVVGADGCVVGCSAPTTAVGAAPRSLKQAQTACVAARREAPASGAVLFDELSGQFRLLDGLDEGALAGIVERTFAPLHQYDAEHRAVLYETLQTLFEHRMAVQETADALHIHRNTLQKRLAHVEQLLDIDLEDLDDIVDIQLGLHAAELLGEEPS